MTSRKRARATTSSASARALRGVDPGPQSSAARADPAGRTSDDPELFLNRELSVLEFHQRVLEQARLPGAPLLERVRFLAISSSNLDEFFEVRVATHKQREAFGLSEADADGLSTRDLLAAISARAHNLVSDQYRVLNEVLEPELQREGICVLRRSAWKRRVRAWVRQYFETQVLPVLTPVALDPAHPFPLILNKSLNFIVTLDGTDAFGRSGGTAILQVPRSLPRLIPVPSEVAHVPHGFVLLSAVIRDRIEDVFPGLEVAGCYQFRVTRNSDLWLDEEEVDDLLKALKGELPARKYGDAVRLEVAMNCPQEIVDELLARFELNSEDLYRDNGPVNLHRLVAIYDKVDRPDLKYPRLAPGKAAAEAPGDVFEMLRARDVLLHHPYESFQPVLDFVRQAASDPNVLAIKQTLYRTGDDSPTVEALLEAARTGKEVTAVIELMARFDEEQNIGLATRLQAAGANVVYGIFGYKTHAKMCLVVRREAEGLRRYVHLGTGNYHAGTARAYTDVGLLTTQAEIAQDVHLLFNELTGLGRTASLAHLVQAPFDLHRTLLEHIEFEAAEASSGRKARIIAKMNSLSEPRIIRALYRASRAGVEIDLIVRGICCLRPGIPGVSENIRVRSIVGRFLEHSRVAWFLAGGARRTYLMSADWMPRNFFHRVEIAFPVLDQKLAERVFDECLRTYLSDDSQAWTLRSDGTYTAAQPADPDRPHVAQRTLLQRLGS